MPSTQTILCVSMVAAFVSSGVDAKGTYPAKLPNVDGPIGHMGGTPGAELNQFAKDFAAADYTWTPELCKKDSDEDGRSNGEELGDPDCAWKEGEPAPKAVKITHPGEKDDADPADSTDAAGSETDMTDPAGNMTDMTDPAGNMTDPAGNMTDPAGNMTDMTDPAGNMTDMTDPTDADPTDASTEAGADPDGPIDVTKPDTSEGEASADPDGKPTTDEKPDDDMTMPNSTDNMPNGTNSTNGAVSGAVSMVLQSVVMLSAAWMLA